MTKTMTAKFAGTCTMCHKRFPVGTSVIWSKGAGARHALASGCAEAVALAAAAPKPERPTAVVGEFSGVVKLFETAKLHLKWPKIRLMVAGVPVTLSLAGPKSKNPGTVTLVGPGRFPDRPWYGFVAADGTWTKSTRTAPEFSDALGIVLAALASDPAGVAKAHGKLTAHCCFCNTKIGDGADTRSIAVGFGPDCAEHWGLSAEWKTGVAAPVAA